MFDVDNREVHTKLQERQTHLVLLLRVDMMQIEQNTSQYRVRRGWLSRGVVKGRSQQLPHSIFCRARKYMPGWFHSVATSTALG